MTNETPDWMRLHKALAFEAENGFIDLVGKQYRFRLSGWLFINKQLQCFCWLFCWRFKYRVF
jgi:hypothetical protein